MAGKEKRKAAALKRKKDRDRKKQQKIALYQGYRDSGNNSKRNKLKRKRTVKQITAISHSSGKCGNIGCHRCSGVNFKAFLVNGVPQGMPQRLYIKWKTEHGSSQKKAT